MLEKFEDLNGKILANIQNLDNERLIFILDNGESYELSHYQDCCESVLIEDINGNLDDLIGYPVLLAECVTNDAFIKDDKFSMYDECHLWTFYKIATIKGYCVIRWFGVSNGYYSVSVDWIKHTN